MSIDKEQLEHNKMLEDLRFLLMSAEGKNVFKYLLKSFGVGELPEQGLEGSLLHEVLGLHRAGISVFQIVSQANHSVAGNLLAQIEKERYDEKMVLTNERE